MLEGSYGVICCGTLGLALKKYENETGVAIEFPLKPMVHPDQIRLFIITQVPV